MKKLLAMILCAAMLLGLCACGDALKGDLQKEEPKEGEKTFTVTVVHKDGTSKDFTYTTTELYLGAVLAAEGLIEGNDGPYGLEITKVDGEQAIFAEDNAYWALYEGDEYAMQGIDQTPIVDGAVYKLVYTGA